MRGRQGSPPPRHHRRPAVPLPAAACRCPLSLRRPCRRWPRPRHARKLRYHSPPTTAPLPLAAALHGSGRSERARLTGGTYRPRPRPPLGTPPFPAGFGLVCCRSSKRRRATKGSRRKRRQNLHDDSPMSVKRDFRSLKKSGALESFTASGSRSRWVARWRTCRTAPPRPPASPPLISQPRSRLGEVRRGPRPGRALSRPSTCRPPAANVDLGFARRRRANRCSSDLLRSIIHSTHTHLPTGDRLGRRGRRCRGVVGACAALSQFAADPLERRADVVS